MARTTTRLTVTVTGDIGPLDQITTGSNTPLTVAVLDASGNQITSFGGGTQYAAGTAAGATDTGTLGLVIRDNVLSNLADPDGDYVALRVDQAGGLWVRQNTNVLTGAIPAGTNNIGDVDVASIAAGDNNIGNVDIASAIPAGTNNIGDVDVLTIPGIVGTIADDATTPGNPVMIGGTAKAFDGTTPGNVSAEDDVSRAITDMNRRTYVNTVHPMFWSYHTNVAVAVSKDIQAAPGSNMAVFITDIVVSSSSTVVGARVQFKEGSTTILGPYYLEAINGRGMAIHFNTPKMVTANTALTLSSPEAVAKAIDVSGFIARVN